MQLFTCRLTYTLISDRIAVHQTMTSNDTMTDRQIDCPSSNERQIQKDRLTVHQTMTDNDTKTDRHIDCPSSKERQIQKDRLTDHQIMTDKYRNTV